MKKTVFSAALLMFFVLGLKTAAADSYNYRPYFGAAYIFNHVKASDMRPEYKVGGVYVGSDYSEYFATELFFNKSVSRKNYPNNGKVKTSYRSYGLDLIAALPLDTENKFSVLATAGIGEYVFWQKFYPNKHENDHGYGYRFGGGLRYSWDNHFALRLLARHVKFDSIDVFKHATEYSMSVEYHF